VEAGDKVMLRFHAQDVAHGVAIGPGLGVDLGNIAPNTTKSVVLVFEEAGTFTFYCNLWCSPNHWRMRGVIDVAAAHDAPAREPAPVKRDPVIDALIVEGVDIDTATPHTEHSADQAATPTGQAMLAPSAPRGAALVGTIVVPSDVEDRDWQQTHTPREGLARLTTANPSADSEELADLTAFLWVSNAAPDQLLEAEKRYAKNCAACHGEKGNGDGHAAGLGPQPPASFADPERMFDRRFDVLYAKIRRGGMGTGMPNFGTVFTPDETWSLVDHLWRLAFGNPEAEEQSTP
jgi:mono/diheme cytochrome c family protein